MNVQSHPELFAQEFTPAVVPMSPAERWDLLAKLEARTQSNFQRAEDLDEQVRQANTSLRDEYHKVQKVAADALWEKLKIVYDHGANYNQIKDNKLYELKEEDDADKYIEHLSCPVGSTQMQKWGQIERNFPWAWVLEDPEEARIEVIATIAECPLAGWIREELWALRKRTSCSNEVMQEVRAALEAWIDAQPDNNPAPTAQKVKEFIRKAYEAHEKKKPVRKTHKKLTGVDSYLRSLPKESLAEVSSDIQVRKSFERLARSLGYDLRSGERGEPAGEEAAARPLGAGGPEVTSAKNDTGTGDVQAGSAVTSAKNGTGTDSDQASSAVTSAKNDTETSIVTPETAEEYPPLVEGVIGDYAPFIEALQTFLPDKKKEDFQQNLYYIIRGVQPAVVRPVMEQAWTLLQEAGAQVSRALFDQFLGELSQPEWDDRGMFGLGFSLAAELGHYRLDLHTLDGYQLPEGLTWEVNYYMQVVDMFPPGYRDPPMSEWERELGRKYDQEPARSRS